MSSADVTEQIRQLEAAIAAQEALRAVLGDAAVDLAAGTLRERLESLRHEADHLLARDQQWVQGERKQVTVLFADLSGFTAIGERTDAEVVRGFQNDLFREMAAAVQEYDGFIEKFVGDAVLAVFGAPVTHEDDAERALRAALAMRSRMAGLNQTWLGRLGKPLTLHIAVNTGDVVAGPIGSELGGAYAVTGDTINTASRLLSAARPGQILVSASTVRLTQGAFTFRRLEPVRFKGKRTRLEVFVLERARAHPGKSRGVGGLSAPLVGRDSELAVLERVGRALLSTHTGAVLSVTGDAGIGKSRLMAEWRRRLQSDGPSVRWLEGRCFGHTVTRAYGPFLDLFRHYAEIRDDESEPEAWSRMRHALQRLIPDDPEAHAIVTHMLTMRASEREDRLLSALSPLALRGRLFGVVQSVFASLGRERPTVLVLEDLHWADQSSLELLRRLLPLADALPLVFVLVLRADAGDASREVHDLLASEGSDIMHLWLRPLSPDSSLQLAEQLLQTSSLPQPLPRLVPAKAEGNPFFVEELLCSLIDRGALVRGQDGRGWSVTSVLDGVAVPDTLKGVLLARLDRLPETTKRVAQQAAVIGRLFAHRVLACLADEPTALDADLQHLAAAGLIAEVAHQPEREYMFKHALTQDAAYESLLGPQRRDLHRRVGEAMEALFSDRLSELHAILGEHYLRGEVWDRAFDHFIGAGTTTSRLGGNLYISTQSYANAEARVHFTRALEALSHLPSNDRTRRLQVDTTIKLASVSIFAEAPERNLALMRRVEAIATGLRDGPHATQEDALQVARIHYWIGRSHHYRNELREAIGYYQQVLRTAQQVGDTELAIVPSLTLGRVVGVQGHFAAANELLNRTMAPLEASENWSEWIWLAGFLGLVLAARGSYPQAIEYGHRALQRAQETQNATGLAASRILLAGIYRFGQDFPRMREAGEAALHASDQAGEHVYAQMAHGILGWANGLMGQYTLAERSLAEMDALGQRLGGQVLLADWFAAARAEIALSAGQYEHAEQDAERALEIARRAGGIFAEGLAQRAWALAIVSRGGNPADALEHLLAAVRLFEAGDCRVELAQTHLAWGLANAHDPGAAGHLEAAALEFERCAMPSQARLARERLSLASRTART